jgi:hypothetical protein
MRDIYGREGTMETWNPTRQEYEATICKGRDGAALVPFVEVTIGDWTPEIADCHNNVDRYVAARPGCEPIRGWICYASFGPDGEGFTAHSVMRNDRGELFDITPVYPSAERGGVFLPHRGDEALFLAMRTQCIHIKCPSLDPAADALALKEMLAESGFSPDSMTDDFGDWYV